MTEPLYLSREKVREVDQMAIQQYHLSGSVLMENAGSNAARLLEKTGIDGLVLVCAGKGNNGGDGLVMARHLDFAGYQVQVLLFGNPEKLTGDARLNYDICRAAEIPLQTFPESLLKPARLAEVQGWLEQADLVVDALLGTGTRGEIREPFSTLVPLFNKRARQIFAIDLPSGLDCDTGKPLGPCIRAAQTATFVALKAGFQNPDSRQYTGEITVLPIGISRLQYQQLLGGQT